MESRTRDAWDMFSLALWSIFFAIGLVPELAFHVLRDISQVVTQVALVNTSAVITVTFTLYLGFFAWRKCREAGLNQPESQVRALQVGLLALIAFLELPAKGSSFEAHTLLEILANVNEIPDQYLKMVVLFVGICKLGAWWYLFQVILRFHAFGNYKVFTSMPTLFSTNYPKPSNETEAPTPTVEKSLPGEFAPPTVTVKPPEMEDPSR